MALIKCPECGNEISDTVKSCPNCGMKIKKKKSLSHKTKKTIIIISMVIIVAIGVVFGVNSILGLNAIEKAQVVTVSNLVSEKMEFNSDDQSKSQLIVYRNSCDSVVQAYSKLKWKQKRKVCEYKLFENKLNSINKKIEQLSSEEVSNVINLINDVGDVSLNSKGAIDEAKDAYKQLDKEQQEKVSNYYKIAEYEQKYEGLCIEETISLINKIGNVTLENGSKEEINKAESSYSRLTAEGKKKVSNYKTLIEKRKNTIN